MSFKEKTLHILAELRGHIPFTLLGATLGILLMLIFRNITTGGGHILFMVFHPLHVVLSAMVTTSMFKIHSTRKSLLVILAIGYFGSIGVATLSDIIMPHIGAGIFGLDIPSHSEIHSLSADAESRRVGTTAPSHETQAHSEGMHFGFIEEWYLVNPAALLGIFIALMLPHTKFPHAAHILVSTWASSAYLLMRLQADITAAAVLSMFFVLFLSVWLPCCFSDIVFPLLFIDPDLRLKQTCTHHWLHSHPHIPQEEAAK